MGKRVGPHGGRVFDISAAITEKRAKWGVKMLKKQFLVFGSNCTKMSSKWSKTVPQHATTAAFGSRGAFGAAPSAPRLRRRAFGAAPVAVAAYGGQITHPKKMT